MTILLEYEFGNKQLGTKTQERLGKPEPAAYLVWDSPEEDLSNNCQKRVKPLFLALPEEATMEGARTRALLERTLETQFLPVCS